MSSMQVRATIMRRSERMMGDVEPDPTSSAAATGSTSSAARHVAQAISCYHVNNTL